MRKFGYCSLVVIGLFCVAASRLEAQVIAYDGFAYPAGPLIGDGPGLGFAAPWTGDPGVTVVAPGLSSPLDLPSTGNAVAGNFNYFAPLTQTLTTGFWASFLLYNAGGNDQAYMGLTNLGIGGTIPAVAFGAQLDRYGIFSLGGPFIPAVTPWSGVGATDFLLANFEPSGADWLVSLYVNPTSLAVPSAVAAVPFVAFNEVLNQNQIGFESDEVRIGVTPADAGFVAVPEPGTLTLLAGVPLLLARRRRAC